MLTNNGASSSNTVWIEAAAGEVWRYVATVSGWKQFLADISSLSSPRDEIKVGDTVVLVIGELTNKASCVEKVEQELIVFDEQYEVVMPDGSLWPYTLQTSFHFQELDGMTKLTAAVDGYGPDEAMQWIRECGEMGWRQSLFHLKTVIELGMDLRNEIFNYPRLGVMNYTAAAEQLRKQGLDSRQPGGNHIATVYSGGPAWKAGLRDGALIVELGGRAVPTYRDFVVALGQLYGKPSVSVEVVYYRDGQRCITYIEPTYDDQFTGMVDPEAEPLSEVAERRKRQSGV
ncbi:PDZ domain-containing protein [Paenibacillus tarimensis]|uniref:PDZ domain-containing protein n=1 Tax=Paenibacillus tarimensis TaxID=416012 RepID=UPI001F1F11BB|nr:PDZ domain-containing protein [Paenibacillus tarimensis]MCF2945597.1 PDZ domain-containing protein [Paenibacillus tarimensis]